MGNILVIDDSGLIRLKLRYMLEEEGFKVFEAVNLKQVKASTFSKETPLSKIDLILLDIYLKEESGLDLLSFLTENYPNIPIIMLSSEAKREVIMKTLEMGAKDYILKPFDKKILLSRINSFISSKSIGITTKEDVFINNLNSFKTNLSLEINRSIRSKLPISILKLKLKGKNLQDKLNKIKEILTNEIRDIDQVFTISEEEFIFLLPLTDKKGVQVILERLKNKLKENIKDIEKNVNVIILTFPDSKYDELEFRKKDKYLEKLLKELEVKNR
jgi:DNA-binding response OmpR family regulator